MHLGTGHLDHELIPDYVTNKGHFLWTLNVLLLFQMSPHTGLDWLMLQIFKRHNFQPILVQNLHNVVDKIL